MKVFVLFEKCVEDNKYNDVFDIYDKIMAAIITNNK